MNQSINHKGDCRTAPATPGLLNILYSFILNLKTSSIVKYSKRNNIKYSLLKIIISLSLIYFFLQELYMRRLPKLAKIVSIMLGQETSGIAGKPKKNH